jgi:general secretion pathway protein M
VQTPPRALSRIAALAILAALLALPLHFGLLPLMQSYRDLSQDLNQKRVLLSRFNTELAGRGLLEQELEEAQESQVIDTIYLRGASEAAAAADLQERLGALAEANRAELRSVQALPAVEQAGLQRLTLRIVMSATTAELFQVLYTLEAEKPYVFIENIMLKVHSREVSEESGDLLVRFDLHGYLNLLMTGAET